MYEIKKNRESGSYELKKVVDFNYHESLLADGKKIFDEVFTREVARVEYFKLRCKVDNDTATPEDLEKFGVMESNGLGFKYIQDCFSYEGCPKQLIGLLYLTVYTHVGILKSCEEDKEGLRSCKFEQIGLGMQDLYRACKNYIPMIETGQKTLEEVVGVVKPLYRGCCHLADHEAEEKICKKWVESDKEKNTRAFLVGLFNRYKITRSNRLKGDSPLKSQSTFEKYVAMWLVTGGKIVEGKKKQNNVVMLESLIKQAQK